jgi:hypothetical protein
VSSLANKRISSDGLIHCDFRLTKVQKSYLDSLGPGKGAAFIRKLLDDAISNRSTEISKLKEKKTNHELEIRMIDAQLAELEKESRTKQSAAEIRESLVNLQVNDLYIAFKSEDGRISKLIAPANNRAEGINQKLNGSGGKPVTGDELIKLLTIKAKAEGLKQW